MPAHDSGAGGPDGLPRNRTTDAFERRVAAVLARLLSNDEPVVVACSGGPDSVAALVATARSRRAGSVVAAYFDHGLRASEETAADAAFVGSVAGLAGGCFTSGAPEEELAGDEAGARKARYRWLAAVCREHGARACVTGHTEDDQAETVLLRLARGTGLRGAGGMRAWSAWPLGGDAASDFHVLRPLLERSRVEVEAYLDALGLEGRVDPTNELVTYARNRVRQRVLPELEELNAGARRHLAEFARRAQADQDALERWAEREFEAHGRVEVGLVMLTRRALRELPEAVSTRVVRIGARQLGLELNSEQVSGSVRALGRSGYEVELEGGIVRSGPKYLEIRRKQGIDT